MGAELHFAVIDAGLSELATAVASSGISTATFSPRAYAEILVRGNTAIEPRETSMLHLLFDLRSTRSARNLARAKSFPLREGAEEDVAAPNAIVIQDRQQEEWTQGCYAAFFPPGGLTSYGSAFRAPCGRIHWAGTETICEWDGHSGRRP